jgi:outer membrane protein insertion porin family
VTRLLKCALGLVWALVLAFSPAPARAVPTGATIEDVRIEGNRRVEPAAIRNAISARKAGPYDPAKIRSDIRALMKLGLFSDVTVEREGTAEAPVLVYRVVERPALREWRVEGNEELSKKDLEENITLKPGQLVDPANVQKDVKKLQEKYVEKGFFLAEVSSRVLQAPDAQVDVIFVVNEHAKVQVKGISFIGNARMPSSEIEKVMMTREGSLLSLVTDAGNYRDENLQRDLQAIQALYLDEGYVTVKVGTPSVALSPDKRFIYVTIPIEEGEQYTIGKIAFAGQLLDQEPRLHVILKSRSGSLFRRSDVAADLFAITDVYKDLGHAYANVSPLTATDPDRRIVDLTFEVQPGKVVSFERIEVIGNDKTRDKVVRRELRIYEGERFSGTGMKVSKQRVTALGFFETVEITTKPGSSDDKVVAIVEVKEKPTGTFQLGAGFSSYENFILTGQISQQNFFGWGQTLSLQLQWSKIRQLGQIQFVEPYFLDTRWTFAFDLYMTEGVYTTFTRRSVGGSLTWGYELSGLAEWWAFAQRLEDMRVFATYTNEKIDVTSAQVVTIARSQFKSGTTSSIRLSLQWDRRDNRLFPTNGYFLTVSGEWAPPALSPSNIFGQEANLFSRYAFDARLYRPVWKGIVARGKLTLGLIRDWDAAHPVPISELYYVGGINSVRGYRYLSIAPSLPVCGAIEPDCATRALSVGGDKQVIVNTELEFPLVPEAGIRMVLFYDMGNAFAQGKWNDPAVPFSVYKAWGFGLRWVSPIGPLRFEWGFPLNRRKDPVTGQYIDQPVDFQFTIGNFF